MNNRQLGTVGENIANSYLEQRGYKILVKNFRVGRMGEIDIIGYDGNTLCFIEVKARTGSQYGTPAQAVSFSKQNTIRRIAQIYMQQNDLLHQPVRFDVVELIITREGRAKDINIIQNAF